MLNDKYPTVVGIFISRKIMITVKISELGVCIRNFGENENGFRYALFQLKNLHLTQYQAD